MSTFEEAQERDMVLYLGSYLPGHKKALARLQEYLDKKLTALVVIDKGMPKDFVEIEKGSKVKVLEIDRLSITKIQSAIKPFAHRIISMTPIGDKNVPLLKSIIPFVPYINSPTAQSLEWTTDKIKMRTLLKNYDKKIAPKFIVVNDASLETIESVKKKVGFPLVIKPSGLAKSLLVTICYHQEELEENLKNTVNKIHKIHKREKGRGEPSILVEEFMEGTMYSIDSYVNQRGVVYHAPLVHIKTGRDIGYDDFFGYQRTTPVNIKSHKQDAARQVAEKAITAMGLRSTTCHIELMKTEDGWKVIELGPRIGGFRSELYELSYGINHHLNDLLIRIPKKPILSKRSKGFSTVMQFYAKRKGKLESITGTTKVKKLESFKRIKIRKKKGEMCDFARNGGDPVFDLVMFNKNRSDLLADIRRVEKSIDIQVKTQSKK